MEHLLRKLEPNPLFPGITFYKHEVEGFIYSDHLGGPEFWKKIGNNFKARESDIYIASHSRTGTTWTMELVYLISHDLDYETAKTVHSHERSPYLNFPFTPLKAFKIASPRCIRTHLPYVHLPQSIKDKNCKIIYTIRNPKDTLVSMYHFGLMNKCINYVGDFDTFFELFITDRLREAPFWKHVLQYWQQRDRENFFMITFEERIKDLHSGIKKVADFLGKDLTDEQVQTLAEHCSFDSMKSNPNVNMEDEDYFDRSISDFIRKGEVGDWKNYFSNEQNEKMNEYVRKNFDGTGLEFTFEL